jgi:uncharacterized protein DUF4386
VSSVQRYARAAGIMFLISFVAGSFGEFYVPSKLIVAGNAAATVSNTVDHEMLFRLGFAGYLLEALCDVALALVLDALVLLLRSRLRLGRGLVHGLLGVRFAHSGLSDISLRLYPALHRRAVRTCWCCLHRQELHPRAGTRVLVGSAAGSGTDCGTGADGVVSRQGCRCRQMERTRQRHTAGASTVACLIL